MGESSLPSLVVYSIGLLQSVPDVVWSGITAAALALGGVLIANRSNTTRLRIQLQHDATEKARERTAVLRREVYLRASEEIVKANIYLASLPQVDLTKTNIGDGLQGFFAASAKLQLIAETNTALLVGKLVSLYGELLLRVVTRLMPLQEAKTDIAINDNLYNKAQEQIARVLSDMAKVNESEQPSQAVFGALQIAFDGYQAQAAEYAAASQEAWTRFNGLNVAFCRQLFVDLRPIGELHPAVMVEIRRDLGLTSDLEAFRLQMQSQWETMSAQLDAVLRSLPVDND